MQWTLACLYLHNPFGSRVSGLLYMVQVETCIYLPIGPLFVLCEYWLISSDIYHIHILHNAFFINIFDNLFLCSCYMCGPSEKRAFLPFGKGTCLIPHVCCIGMFAQFCCVSTLSSYLLLYLRTIYFHFFFLFLFISGTHTSMKVSNGLSKAWTLVLPMESMSLPPR